MTNREDTQSPFQGLGPEHRFARSKSHYMLNHQLLDGESFMLQEVLKDKARKTATGGKMLKPTMEIYRPPPKAIGKNGSKVHFQSPLTIDKGQNQSYIGNELKSALKRSKSFTSNDSNRSMIMGFDKDAFPIEYQGLIRNATLDPNLLSSMQLMELVRLICSKAVESTQNAQPAAQLCFSIIEKEVGMTFLDSLLNACREWFNERDKLLRSPFTNIGTNATHAGSRRWNAYLSFLTELFLYMNSHMHQQWSASHLPKTNGENPHHALPLLTLLYECSFIVLKPPAVNNVAEIECLRSMLFTVGKQLERDAPQRMQQVVAMLRDAFVNPSVTAQIRKTILELVELHASNWQLDLSQSVYYFPYTSVDRK